MTTVRSSSKAVPTDMCVRNSYLVTLKNDQKSRRTGCEFLRLGAQQEATLQRYIIRLERDRRTKTARQEEIFSRTRAR